MADVDVLLRAGADKVSINTAAIARPELLAEMARQFDPNASCSPSMRAQCRWLGAHPVGLGGHHPRRAPRYRARRRRMGFPWSRFGGGEILLNSMDADGTKAGFDLEMLQAVRSAVTVPVIASGGAGAAEHFAPAIAAGADAVLAASVFHFRELTIGQVKAAMAKEGITVR